MRDRSGPTVVEEPEDPGIPALHMIDHTGPTTRLRNLVESTGAGLLGQLASSNGAKRIK